MSLGDSNMAGNALGMAFSLLLLAYIIQGLRDVELYRSETVEGVVGQNITLPCIVKNPTDLKIVSIEWSKKTYESTKLALYSSGHGYHYFKSNVTILLQHNDANKLTGSYLNLSEVKKWDSGIYVCEITTFPFGTLRDETELIVKDDIKITCDADGIIEVHNGENVTIRCRLYPHAQYRWTKNNELVSENESLALWWVTDALAGVYTFTLNTGNNSLQKEFTITVLTATTSLRTDLVTASPQGLTESADSSLNASVTTELSAHANWTMNMDTVNPNTSDVTVTAIENITSSTQSTHIDVTSSPATHSTRSSYGSTVFKETTETVSYETRNESTIHPADIFSTRLEETSTLGNISQNSENPDAAPTLNAETTVIFTKEKDAVRSHLLPLIIVPMMVLTAVAGFLYRRQIIKKRMDLPPPFKPPPPPVKYTAARQSEDSTQFFPTSRCNSVVESKDMQQMFVMT
ncbi:T-cell surface protein tactile [Acanthochromis polyacanthus]|uniref:T-cell surface protein tactile n=1 Tax=Acanthochromis polyacanthus TaxID=80966 RepID=UPI002234C182|nr:T-cell surface protein tactile [Acanthochromis polyacanthus]